ncbi:hypothetical protein H0H93_016525 [Arthromyces matolae]|nr:hypothetical protein H0H93_016525 [Arthromyces matolae]
MYPKDARRGTNDLALLYRLRQAIRSVVFYILLLLWKLRPKSRRRKIETAPLDWREEDLVNLFRKGNNVFGSVKYDRMGQITDKTLVKSCSPYEVHAIAEAMNLVASQTDIHIPRVQKAVVTPEGFGLLVTDFIPGAKQLGEIWRDMSWWEKLKVALTLREYIDSMRKIQYPHSNRIGNPFNMPPDPIEGLQFSNRGGPRAGSSKQKLASFFRSYRSRLGRRVKRLPRSLFDTLVFTHNDLNMRNILVDENGTLWIVDWDWAGFLPPWFEYYAARSAALKDMEEEDWFETVPLIIQPFPEVDAWMHQCGFHIKPSPFVRRDIE